MSNKNQIKLAIPVIILLIGFFLENWVSEFINKRISSFVDIATLNTISILTSQNQESIDILKNGQFTFKKEQVLSGTESRKLSKYFRYETTVKKKTADNNKIPKAKAKFVKAPVYHISSVYIGKNLNYVIIDGQLLKAGEKTPRGEKILQITKTRIKVQGKWGTRWINIKI